MKYILVALLAVIAIVSGIGITVGQGSDPYTQHKSFTGIFHGNMWDHDCSIKYDINSDGYITNGYFYIAPITDEQTLSIPGAEGTFEGSSAQNIPYSGNLIIHNPAGGPVDGDSETGTIYFGDTLPEYAQFGKTSVYYYPEGSEFGDAGYMMIFHEDFRYTGPLPPTEAETFTDCTGHELGCNDGDSEGIQMNPNIRA